MKKSSDYITAIGLTIFFMGACCMDSHGAGMVMATTMVSIGLVMIYIGSRKEKRSEETT